MWQQINPNVVYISITEGLGTGIIINDHIYKSSHKKAGEFGHMKVSDEDRRCNCGRTGCWELFASKKALFRYFKESTGSQPEDLVEVFRRLEAGEPEVEQAVKHYMQQLFIGIENIILGLNPEYVIIGGELGRYSNELMTLADSHENLKELLYGV